MITIQTHNGRFHADEVSSIALMTSYFSQKDQTVSVIRSRDSENFEKADMLIDVGLEYDHERKRYDHHQASCKEVWSEKSNVPLSSVGLIWRHYGKEIVTMYLNSNSEEYTNEETVEDLWNLIYEKIFLEIDAHDNGILLANPSNNLNIPTLVASANGDTSNDEEQKEHFETAVSLVAQIFHIKFKEIISSYFNFQKDYEIVSQMDLSGPYLVVPKDIQTAYKCLTKLDPECKIKFLIFEDPEKNEYTVKTRRLGGYKFISLCPIASEEILRDHLSNPNDIIFVHKTRFIAKASTLETSKEIVEISLKNEPVDFILDSSLENSREEIKDRKYLFGTVGVVSALTLGGLLYWKFKD